MNYAVSPLVTRVEAPPIAEAMSWVRQGPRNRDLINLCQAVPSYPPAETLQTEFGRVALLPAQVAIPISMVLLHCGQPTRPIWVRITGLRSLPTMWRSRQDATKRLPPP